MLEFPRAFVVELVENSLQPIVEELEHWESIIGEYYIEHKQEELRNSLAYKPEAYTTIYREDLTH